MTATLPPVLVRTYQGKTNIEAATAYAVEAREFGEHGYQPTGQTWVAPPMARRIITPIVFFVVGIILGSILLANGGGGALLGAVGGILAGIAYVVFAKPDGVLTVTYALEA